MMNKEDNYEQNMKIMNRRNSLFICLFIYTEIDIILKYISIFIYIF